MKRSLLRISYIVMVILQQLCFGCNGQTKTDTISSNDEIIIRPYETLPSFPGGDKEMYKFIDRSIDKEKLSKIDTVGTAWVQFTIDTTGKLSDVIVVKSLLDIVDLELIRIIKIMPKWEPGNINGNVVKTKYMMPLTLPYEKKFSR